MKNWLKQVGTIAAGVFIGLAVFSIVAGVITAIVMSLAVNSITNDLNSTRDEISRSSQQSVDEYRNTGPSTPTPAAHDYTPPPCPQMFDPTDPNRNPLCDPNFDPENYSENPDAG